MINEHSTFHFTNFAQCNSNTNYSNVPHPVQQKTCFNTEINLLMKPSPNLVILIKINN